MLIAVAIRNETYARSMELVAMFPERPFLQFNSDSVPMYPKSQPCRPAKYYQDIDNLLD